MKKKQRGGKKTLKYVGYVAPWSLAGHISLSCTLNVLDKRYILHLTALRAVQAALTHTRHLLTPLRKGYRCLGERVHIARRPGESSQWDHGTFATSQSDVAKSRSGKKNAAKVLRPHSESRPVCRHWYADCSQGHRTLAGTRLRISATAATSIFLGILPDEAFFAPKRKTKRRALR